MSSAGKVGAALKISEADQATIVALRREIEKAWKVVKDSQDKARRWGPHFPSSISAHTSHFII